eukprot:TRINITY_DN115319_c0_g1_i1.p1 TRINITY_DN115319_c0_g1~~TRINITY_DN115319_c0_g1_i1.p1  ORF type:complete len:179 (-),score=25.15 TRINITY_DN115319_c0_g1_i1:268-780(-)
MSNVAASVTGLLPSEDNDGNEEEFEITGTGGTEEDMQFDEVIGKLEEILIDDEFQDKQDAFFREHCHEFTHDEENKFIYTEIHKKYEAEVETYIEDRLKEEIAGFDMEHFLKQMQERKDQVQEELMELLWSFTEFVHFKQLILDFKDARDRAADSPLKISKVQHRGFPPN